MIISVASGKGGTGKTTVAACLASVISQSVYIDCDVEEPNGHLLLHPEILSEEYIFKLLPLIDYNKCDLCGKCVEICEFNALINLKSEILLFKELCHSCGACEYFCPLNSINETSHEIGKIRNGTAEKGNGFFDGSLNIGEISTVQIIKKVKEKMNPSRINIIDSPPGTSCAMVETIRNSDYCILVTESTPFGLNDLKLAIDVVKTLLIPFGVVINKYDYTYNRMENYLNEKKIDILLKIPFEREIAEDYSNGILPIWRSYKLRESFLKLSERIVDKTEIRATNER